MDALMPILLDVAIKAAVILLVAAVIALVLRRNSAAARHMVWTAAVVAVLLLPAMSYLLPGLAVLPEVSRMIELAEPTAGDGSAVGGQAAEATRHAVEGDRYAANVPRTEPVTPASPPDAALSSPVMMPAPPGSSSVANEAASTVAVEHAEPTSASALWQRVLAWLPWVWLGGASFALLPIILGAVGLARLRYASQPVTANAWRHLLTQLQSEISLRHPVVLRRSRTAIMPMTWGGWPGLPATVLVPVDSEDWSAERRRAVLLHELAHVKRRDCLTQLLTQLACALYWFNPLVWYAAHRMLIERERACDDLVLTHETKASDYAQHLLDIATDPQAGMFATHAGIAMARRSKLDGRLVAILDQHRNRRAMSRLGGALTITLIGAVAVPVAMLQAESEPAAEEVVEVASNDESTQPTSGSVVRQTFDDQPAFLNFGREQLDRDAEFLLGIEGRDGLRLARERGVDAIFHPEEPVRGLLVVETTVFPMGNLDNLDVQPDASHVERLDYLQPATLTPIRADLPMVYLFRTRENVTGLLRIVEVTEDPWQLTIEYRLIETAEAALDQEVEDEHHIRLFERANALVDHLEAGRFEQAREHFDDRMRQALSAEALEQLWQQLEETGGEYHGRGEPYHRREQDHDVIYVPLRWANNAIDLKVVFDDEVQIAGLWTMPPGEAGGNGDAGEAEAERGDLLRELVASRQRQFERVQQQMDAGRASPDDVEQARQALIEAQLRLMDAQQEAARSPEEGETVEAEAPSNEGRGVRWVYIVGDVQRPGAYVLPEDETLTLLQLVMSVGNLTEEDGGMSIEVLRRQPDGRGVRLLPQTRLSELLEGETEAPALQTDDVIIVRAATQPPAGEKPRKEAAQRNDLLRELVESHQRQFERAQRLLNAGRATPDDVGQAREALIEARLRLLEADRVLDQESAAAADGPWIGRWTLLRVGGHLAHQVPRIDGGYLILDPDGTCTLIPTIDDEPLPALEGTWEASSPTRLSFVFQGPGAQGTARLLNEQLMLTVHTVHPEAGQMTLQSMFVFERPDHEPDPEENARRARLVAIGLNPHDENTWWLPDGTPLTGPPFNAGTFTENVDYDLLPQNTEVPAHVVAILLQQSGGESGVVQSISYRYDPAPDMLMPVSRSDVYLEQQRADDGIRLSQVGHLHLPAYEVLPETLTLQAGIADHSRSELAAAWFPHREGGQIVNEAGMEATFALPRPRENNPQVHEMFVTHTAVDQENERINVIFRMQDGQQVDGAVTQSQPTGDSRTRSRVVIPPPFDWEQVEEVRLELTPIRWQTIEVPLQPDEQREAVNPVEDPQVIGIEKEVGRQHQPTGRRTGTT